MLLQLKIFNRKSDPHAYRTVIGDVPSIFELHFMLKTSPRQDGLAVLKMEVTNMEGQAVDTTKAMAEWHAMAVPLSHGQT